MDRISTFALTAALVLVSTLSARADSLRNVKVGEEVPPYTLRTLDNQTIASQELKGRTIVLVYMSAEQTSSESAAATAYEVVRNLVGKDVELILATADATKAEYFREWRDRAGVHEPLALDLKRELYGGLGLIVLPTTVVIDAEGRLAHVISSFKTNYEHVLRSYILHTIGELTDAQLDERLKTETFERGRPEDKIARHRAAAELMRKNGLPGDAENELKAALQIVSEHAGALLDLAYLYVTTDRVEQAAEIVRNLLEGEPNHRRGRLMQGIVLYHQDQLDEAQRILEEVLLLNPDPVFTHYYLGLIAEKKGETEKAVEHFHEALQRMLRERAA